MQLDFLSPAAATAAFQQAAVIPLFFTAAVALTLFSPKVRAGIGYPIATLLSCSFFAILMGLVYAITYRPFISAQVDPNGITLQFTGPFARQVVVPRADIAEVLFGLHGKSAQSCTLAILTSSGTTYRSAKAARPVADCKAMRGEVLATLKWTAP